MQKLLIAVEQELDPWSGRGKAESYHTWQPSTQFSQPFWLKIKLLILPKQNPKSCSPMIFSWRQQKKVKENKTSKVFDVCLSVNIFCCNITTISKTSEFNSSSSTKLTAEIMAFLLNIYSLTSLVATFCTLRNSVPTADSQRTTVLYNCCLWYPPSQQRNGKSSDLKNLCGL